MIAIDKKLVDSIIELNKIELQNQHNRAYKKLQKVKEENILSREESHYIRFILGEFKKINLVTASLEEIHKVVEEIGELPEMQKRSFGGKESKTTLKDEILAALAYEKKRSDFYPEYFNKLGIKTCVYCNSQLVLSLEKKRFEDKKYIAKFQVDHYFPKSKYPYLSIALFNLYPACSSCNLAKRKDEVQFELYQHPHKIEKDLMGFHLDPFQKAKFLVSRNCKDLEYTFYNKECGDYDQKFHITEIYNTQKDVAEEIILMAQAYDKNLREQLKGLGNISDALIDRIILGNYTDPNDIHKRPMAKFMQDIAREAGLKI